MLRREGAGTGGTCTGNSKALVTSCFQEHTLGRWSQQAPPSPLLPPHSGMPGTKANFLSPLSSPYVDHTFLSPGAGCGRGPYEAGGNRDETGP